MYIDDLVEELIPVIRYSSLAIGIVCLFMGSILWFSSYRDKKRVDPLQVHHDGLQSILNQLSSKWKSPPNTEKDGLPRKVKINGR